MSPAPSAVRRRRLVATGLVVLAVAGAALLAARVAGGGPPEDGLARLVPADALVYLHASIDPEREADAALERRLERLPGLRRLRADVRRTIGRGRVRRWLGDEAAVAVLPVAATTRTETLVLAAVADPRAARRFLRRNGAVPALRHRGVEVLVFRRTSVALDGKTLLAGSSRVVQAAIDRRAGEGSAGLADAPAYTGAELEDPLEDAVAELYASATGARTVLAPRLGLLREALQVPLRAQLAPAQDGDGLRARARLRGTGGAGFAPRLLAAAPSDAAGVLALASLEPLVTRLTAAIPAIVPAARAAGVDLERDLVAPFRGREVVAWADTADPAAPSLAVAGRTRDPARTREALGRLQGPLVEALAPGEEAVGGRASLFEQRTVSGVPAFVLAVAPGVELAYAVIGSDVVVATSAEAIARVRSADPERARRFGPKGIGVPESGAKAIGSVDPGQLLAFGDQLGIVAGSSVQRLREDLGQVTAIAAAARREGTDTTAELSFQIP